MTIKTPDRIIELWPMLSPEARAQLTEVAESIAVPILPLHLTDDERAQIEQAREDFRAGRILSEENYRLRMDAFMTRMRSKYQLAS